ncbi:hypothetical protein Tco_0633651 [Tanacetum coccineum]
MEDRRVAFHESRKGEITPCCSDGEQSPSVCESPPPPQKKKIIVSSREQWQHHVQQHMDLSDQYEWQEPIESQVEHMVAPDIVDATCGFHCSLTSSSVAYYQHAYPPPQYAEPCDVKSSMVTPNVTWGEIRRGLSSTDGNSLMYRISRHRGVCCELQSRARPQPVPQPQASESYASGEGKVGPPLAKVVSILGVRPIVHRASISSSSSSISGSSSGSSSFSSISGSSSSTQPFMLSGAASAASANSLLFGRLAMMICNLRKINKDYYINNNLYENANA